LESVVYLQVSESTTKRDCMKALILPFLYVGLAPSLHNRF